jgi:glycosyltransferase involved in cell wall biosynthesis
MEVAFWICVIGGLYSYFLYPLILCAIPARRSINRVHYDDRPYQPSVTLIIAARNEKGRMREKLENSLRIDYPDIDIIVASDCSDDGSDEIVKSFASQGIRLVRSPDRRGKEYAQGLALEAARGEIVVFSDAGTQIPPGAIAQLVERFADPDVGAVSSEDQFISADGSLVGEGLYVRFEMWLRKLETKRAGLVGLSGSFFAIRKSIVTTWDSTIPSDFVCALNAVRAGKIAVSDPRVRGVYRDIKDPSKEYQRKVRTAIRGMTALFSLPEVLNPAKYGLFSFQVWSHKVMRWLTPWFLLGLLLLSVLRSHEAAWILWLLYAQLVGYGAVLAAHWLPMLRRLMPLRIAYYFVQASAAIAVAGVRYLLGERVVVWEPSTR